MAGNLTTQVRNIADVTTAVANGDLSKKITVDVRGEILELKNTINTMVDQLSSFAAEVTRVAREVGTEGKLGGQAEVRGVARHLEGPDRQRELHGQQPDQPGAQHRERHHRRRQRRPLQEDHRRRAQGEILELKNTINTMVDSSAPSPSEVTRVAREVGTEGKLGGQAEVQGVAGTWKDLTDNVNFMAANLTNQVRGIAKRRDRGRQRRPEAQAGARSEGRDRGARRHDQRHDRHARDLRRPGHDGRARGRYRRKAGRPGKVPGAAGTWRDLTDNVNRLAAQPDHAGARHRRRRHRRDQGRSPRSIAVDAAGEVAALKDNINEMIRNLKDTTQKNTEQDWLKTNLAKFTRLLQGQRDLQTVSRTIMSELAPLVSMQHGVFYLNDSQNGAAGPVAARQLRLHASARTCPTASRRAKGWSASAPSRSRASSSRRSPATTCRSAPGSARPRR